MFDWAKIPGLSDEEHRALGEHDEAHIVHSTRVMGKVIPSPYEPDDSEEARQLLQKSNRRLRAAYETVSRLASQETPGREAGVSYEQLLQTLRKYELGERDGVLASDPPIPWHELPAPKLLMYAMLDLDEYFFLTRGAPGAPHLLRLFDLPDQLRNSLSEEDVSAAHGNRNELLIRLYRLLGMIGSDAGEERQRSMDAFGYDCGYDLRVFYSRYESDEDYVNGFVEGALELAGEEAEGDEREILELMEALWQEPSLTREEKYEQVLEPLKLDCRVSEDEGELWKL